MAPAATPRVIVVGLGPAGPDLIDAGTRALLDGGHPVYLRTNRHPAAADLAGHPSFDHRYEEAASFDDVYRGIVEDLVAAARAAGPAEPVVYAVPGSPLVAERTVALLSCDPRVAVEVRPALSFLDLAWARLAIDPVEAGVRLVDAARFTTDAAGERGPLLVAQCWSRQVLSSVKLSVDDGGEPPGTVTILHHLGLPDEVVASVGWWDLDRTLEADHLTSLWVPRMAAPIAGEMAALAELGRTLRRECPWDREQTHRSLARHLLEETYETLDAIDHLPADVGPGRPDPAEVRDGGAPGEDAEAVAHLEEELGDLLFQVVFHSTLAAEEGRFTLADVARGIHEKLVARHPHVFGDVVAETPAAVAANWDELKRAEKGRTSVTEGVPTAQPALALAAALQRKAASAALTVGAPDVALDRTLGQVLDGQPDLVGPLLFAVVAAARRAGVDAEEALRATALRYRDRIVEAEQALHPGGSGRR